jgi:hypothetical protein
VATSPSSKTGQSKGLGLHEGEGQFFPHTVKRTSGPAAVIIKHNKQSGGVSIH